MSALPGNIWDWYSKNYNEERMHTLLRKAFNAWAARQGLTFKGQSVKDFVSTVIGYLTTENDLPEAISLGLNCFVEDGILVEDEEELVNVVKDHLLKNYKNMVK